MPFVKAINTCFVDNSLRNEGDTFEYNGPPNRHLVEIKSNGEVVAVAPVPTPKAKAKAAGTWQPKPRHVDDDGA
jgi:hypothetical protein